MPQVLTVLRGAGRTASGRLSALIADWIAAERGRFALWLPVLMGTGDLAYFGLRWEPAGWIGSAFLGLCLAAMALTWKLPFTRAVFAAGAAAALGFSAAQLATARALPVAPLPRRATFISGVVLGVESLPEGRRITLGFPKPGDYATPLARRLRIRLRNDDPATIETGDAVRVRALVRPPSPPTHPGGWDIQRDAFFAGIGGYGFALGRVTTIARGPPQGFAAWVWRLRETIAARVAAAIPGPDGAIATTLLTGLTAAIPKPDRAAFRDSGLAHLLAIAGLHIGIVMGLVFGFTRLLLAFWEHAALAWPTKQIAALAALAAGGFYMLLTGMHVPIIRSFAMACLVTLGLLAGRRAFSLRGLGLAAAALILIAPSEITGASFQMSFSAVLALIAGYAALRPWLRGWQVKPRLAGRLGRHAAGLAITSLLAGTASAPFAAYHFGHVQLYFIVANVVAVPLTALWVMPAGLMALLLMPLSLERVALVPMGWGVHGLLAIARTVASWPAATLSVPHMPAAGLAVLAFGLAWLGLWRTPVRLAGVPIILAALASPWLTQPPDLLVSADARLIAVRTTHGVFVYETRGAARFTQESWEQFWADGPVLPMNVGPRMAPEEITCDSRSCLLRAHPGGPAALLLMGAADPEDDDEPTGCEEAVVVVSPEPARGRCFGPPLVDRFTVWRNGAYAVWLRPGGADVVSDRVLRGERPWVPPPPRPHTRRARRRLSASSRIEW